MKKFSFLKFPATCRDASQRRDALQCVSTYAIIFGLFLVGLFLQPHAAQASDSYATQLFSFDLSGQTNITKLHIDLTAFATASAGPGIVVKIFNNTGNSWFTLSSLGNTAIQMPSSSSSQEITSNISYYLDGSSQVQILVSSLNPSVSGTDAVLSVDFMQLLSMTSPVVSSINPASVSNINQSVSLTGQNFVSGDTVTFQKTGQSDISCSNVDVTSDTALACDANFRGATTGTWDIVVTDPNTTTGTLAAGLTITEATHPQFTAIGSVTMRGADNLVASGTRTPDNPQANGAGCISNSDCQSNICTANVCTAAPVCGDAGYTVTYGSHDYTTVLIGSQCWFKENLNVGTMLASGSTMPADPAPTTNDPNTVSKWCYSNSATNCTNQGGLYTWAEANDLTATCNGTSCTPAAGNQGICPTGWHIPTDAEQYTLENYLKTGATSCVATRGGWDCDGAGTSMKTVSSTTLSVPLAGDRDTDGSLYNQGTYAYLWSASEASTSVAWSRFLYSGTATVYRNYNAKEGGFSVRCLKN